MWRPVLVLAVALTSGVIGGCRGDPQPAVRPSTTASTTTAPSIPTAPSTTAVASTTTAVSTTTGAPVPPSAGSTAPETVTPDGFERVRATITEPDGTTCELCVWLADTGDRRSRGLMFVTDLGDADGMAFVYPRSHSGSFWMKNTLLPLSIAFFGDGGAYLDAFDMVPCAADPCPLYRTPDDFLVAIETIQGGLADLGIVPGSVLDLTDQPCGDVRDR